MANFLIGLLTVGLVILCLFLVLIILMQRASTNSGMGSAMGGGVAENTLGVDSGNVLTRWTIYGAVAFFVITFGLYLLYMNRVTEVPERSGALPEIEVLEEANGEAYTPGSLTEVGAEEAKK